jgi:kynurenine formamidase
MEEISRYDAKGPAWYWNNFSCGEHTGTHFDAPIHWVSGKDLPNNTTDTIEAQNFIAPACVIDCSAQSALNPDFILTVEVIEAWEAVHGKIPAGTWVFLRTDWSKRSGAAYANVQADGAHTPGPNPEAVRFLIEQRDVLGFGVETIGTDAGQAHGFTPPYPAHFFMHGKGRYGLQCMTNLDQLPPTGALIVSPPLKIKGGSGSPLRVLALVAA